jgi:signal peptidase
MGSNLLRGGLLVLLCLPVVLYALTVVVPGFEGDVVASGSMEPAISAGSIVFVAEEQRYEPGDVATFERRGRVVTHRIVEHSGIVPESAIRGRVVYQISLYGHLVLFAGSWLGYLTFVLVPGVALLSLELGRLRTHLVDR